MRGSSAGGLASYGERFARQVEALHRARRARRCWWSAARCRPQEPAAGRRLRRRPGTAAGDRDGPRRAARGRRARGCILDWQAVMGGPCSADAGPARPRRSKPPTTSTRSPTATAKAPTCCSEDHGGYRRYRSRGSGVGVRGGSHWLSCHCEERSDAAISGRGRFPRTRLPRRLWAPRNDGGLNPDALPDLWFPLVLPRRRGGAGGVGGRFEAKKAVLVVASYYFYAAWIGISAFCWRSAQRSASPPGSASRRVSAQAADPRRRRDDPLLLLGTFKYSIS